MAVVMQRFEQKCFKTFDESYYIVSQVILLNISNMYKICCYTFPMDQCNNV